MQYTISAVSPNSRTFQTKFGDMVGYKIKFQETGDTVIEWSRKAGSPAPQAGERVEGNVDMNGAYGPKFKMEYGQAGGGRNFTNSPSQSGTSSHPTGKPQSDQYTMYLSYAKDIAVALIGTENGFDDDTFGNILESVTLGGHVLQDGREKPQGVEKTSDQGVQQLQDTTDYAPNEQDVIDLMGDGSKPIDISEIPF